MPQQQIPVTVHKMQSNMLLCRNRRVDIMQVASQRLLKHDKKVSNINMDCLKSDGTHRRQHFDYT